MNKQQMTPGRPKPDITPLTRPFWSALKSRQLVVQQCADCATYRFPPDFACFSCASPDYVWATVSGRAFLYSWTITHPPTLPYFNARAPWPVVAVELEEGPRMISTLKDVPLEEYEFGMKLEADFEDIDRETTLVVFRRRS
jgi:uncharacterized OB-fold protein